MAASHSQPETHLRSSLSLEQSDDWSEKPDQSTAVVMNMLQTSFKAVLAELKSDPPPQMAGQARNTFCGTSTQESDCDILHYTHFINELLYTFNSSLEL